MQILSWTPTDERDALDAAIIVALECLALAGWKSASKALDPAQEARARRIELELRTALRGAWNADAQSIVDRTAQLPLTNGVMDAEVILAEISRSLSAESSTLVDVLAPAINRSVVLSYGLGRRAAYDVKPPINRGVSEDFVLQDDAAHQWLKRDTNFWVGNHANAVIGRGVADAVRESVIEAGGSRRDAARLLKEKVGPLIAGPVSDAHWEVVAAAAVVRSRSWGSTYGLAEAGFTTYKIVNPEDEVTSEICKHAVTLTFRVENALALRGKLEAVDNPEDHKALTPWLKPNDVVGKSASELAAAGVIVPPLHGNCRSTLDADEEGAIAETEGMPPLLREDLKRGVREGASGQSTVGADAKKEQQALAEQAERERKAAEDKALQEGKAAAAAKRKATAAAAAQRKADKQKALAEAAAHTQAAHDAKVDAFRADASKAVHGEAARLAAIRAKDIIGADEFREAYKTFATSKVRMPANAKAAEKDRQEVIAILARMNSTTAHGILDDEWNEVLLAMRTRAKILGDYTPWAEWREERAKKGPQIAIENIPNDQAARYQLLLKKIDKKVPKWVQEMTGPVVFDHNLGLERAIRDNSGSQGLFSGWQGLCRAPTSITKRSTIAFNGSGDFGWQLNNAAVHEFGHAFNNGAGPGASGYTQSAFLVDYLKYESKKTQKGAEKFITEYSKKNPGEDFAECFSFYLQTPSLLKQKAPDKYNAMHRLLSSQESFDNTVWQYHVERQSKLTGANLEAEK